MNTKGISYYKSAVDPTSNFSLGTVIAPHYREQLTYVLLCDMLQRQHGISGAVCEIGIFLGDYFCMLASCADASEAAVAIDLFETQENNVDGSGRHDRTIRWHEQEYQRRVGSRPRPTWIQGDSLRLTAEDLLSASKHQFYRLISIDGGHEHYHVANDLGLAQQVLTHGGMVIADDYTNAGWPGVAEGVARHFLLGSYQRLAPLFLNNNKLVLTTISHHAKYLSALEAFLKQSSAPYVDKALYGHTVLVPISTSQIVDSFISP